MFKLKRAFFQWLVFVILLGVGMYYAHITGFTKQLLIDKTYISLGIIGVTVLTIFHLGITSWRLDYASARDIHLALMWPGEAISNLPLMGIGGTVLGFFLQANTLMSGTAGLGPLGTSLFATFFGVVGALLVRILRFNVRYCATKLHHQREIEEATLKSKRPSLAVAAE